MGHNFLFLFSRDQVAYPNLNSSDPGEAFSGPLAGQLYATLNVPVHKYVTIAPKIGFWYAAGGIQPLLRGHLGINQQNHVYGR